MSKEEEDEEDNTVMKAIGEGLAHAIRNGKLDEFLPQLIVFIVGFRAGLIRKLDFFGALTIGGIGLIGLSLAKSNGIPSQAAGIGILSALGLLNVIPSKFTNPFDPESFYFINPEESCRPGYKKEFDPVHHVFLCHKIPT